MKYYIGIDFGHGETTVSRVPGYNGEPVSQIAIKDGSAKEDKKIISAVCKKNNEWSLVYGAEDFKSSDLREGFKAMISKMTDKDKLSMRKFAELVFQSVIDNDSDLSYNPDDPDDRNFRLGIACPSDWVRVDHKAPQDYLNFFRYTCNLPVDCCIRESDAAFFTKFSKYQNTDNVFVIDIGSSTIDFTTYANSKCIEACCWGANLGAHQIEDALLKQLKRDPCIISNITRLNEFRASKGAGDATSAISLFFRTQKERYFSEKQQEYSLMVPFKDLTVGWSGGPWDVCIGFQKTKPEFEQIISGYKQSIRQVLENAKIKLSQNGISLTHVLLSGGASRMPFIKEYAKDIFGENVQIDRDAQPECVVSNGIALYSEAFDNACRELGSILRGVDFATIYRDADTAATAKAIERLIPSVVAQIKQDSGCTGERMRKMFCNFIRGLDENNDRFKELVSSELNATISSKAADAISSAYKRVFKIGVDTSDVKIQVEADILPFDSSNFEEGGGWYNRITEYIKKSSGCMFDGAFFTWDQARDFDERCRIADGVKSCLVSSSTNIAYGNLDSIVQYIERQVFNYTIDIFKDKQLFDMTFKH